MKRFLIRQLTLVLTVAIMMPMTGLAEGTLLNGTAALSTDVDIVAVTETDEEPVEASEIDLPVEEETLVEELNNDNNPDVILPSENVIPAKPGEDLSGETDVPADPDTMPLDDVENASEPISESSGELDNPGNAPDVTDGENQTSTNDDQVIDPQDQGDTTEPVENEGESQSDGISSENIPTENETVVSDQAFTTESNSEDAVPVISTEEQILSEEIQFEETELPKLAAAGPTIPASLTMGLKEKYQLTGGSSYTSSNPKVATVSASGLIIAKKKGNTTINAGGAVCQVTVKAAPKKVKLPKKQTVIAGQSIILTAKVSGGASANITWTSSNPSVATVDSSGMVTGISMGKAKITAKTYNKKKATCTVTVESANAPTMVSFPVGTLFVGKGESVQLKPVLNPGAETKFTFTSKNKKVATVNKSSGLLKGKKVKKSTKITVTTHNKKKATLTVKVLKAPSNVTLSIPSATLDIGGAVAVTASLPSKTASQIYWSSDNPGVANVSDASPFSDGTNSTITVTAVGAGTATITARTFNGKTASCAITVNAPPAPAPAPSGGETNNNNKDNTGDTPSVPEIAEPAIDSIINSNPTQGSPLVIVITNVTSNQEYKADVYTFNEDGTRTLIKEYGLDATGNTITIPTEELSMGDYYVRVTTSSADGSTSKSVDVGEITVEESAELLTPSVSINNTTPKQGAVLTIGIKNADQGKGESYKAVIRATEYNKEFVSVDGNKTIEIDTTSIPSGNYSLTVVVSANGNSKETDPVFTADGVERYTNSVNPGYLTYSLSDLAGNIPIASLPVGDYSIRITAVANGETRILADKSFQPVDLDGEVDEATVQDVVKFVSDNSNASLFPSTYVNSALGRMNASDVLIMAINSRNSWVYGMASTLFTENHENLYLVDLYESELADIIADMNPNTIQLENISSTEKLVADAIMDYGTDILSVFQESSNLNSTTTEFLQEDFTELSSKLKRIKDGVKGTKMSIELANNLSKAMCNYVNGLEILTMVSDSMGTNNSPEFKLAVQRMHAKYKSESFNVVMNMLEVFTKELINMSTKEITTAMVNLGSELGSKVNGGMLYSIVNFAIDASMKLTGYSDIADDYQTFMIQVEAYNTGRNTYENAFYAVKGGDTSARAINRLLVAFTYTKQSSLRIHETISNLRSTPTDEMKNILDYTTKLKNTSIAN